MTHSQIFKLIAVLALLISPTVARADEIAVWNFNDDNLIVDHGAGTLTTNFIPANVVYLGGSVINARQGDVAGDGLSLRGGTANANNGRNITFGVSTLCFTNIVVSFATRGTITGFNSNQFHYSLDGIAFTNFGAPYTPPASFGLITFDLSSISGINENPNAAFRIVFDGASNNGNNRMDNLVVEGRGATAVPEPSTILLLGTSLFGLGAKMRHWMKVRR